MRIAIINGPNLNLLGTREPGKYGSTAWPDILEELRKQFPGVVFTDAQSNVEGELVNRVQETMGRADALLLNAGGYTHTSVALADAVAALSIPVVEVHLTNIAAREPFRQKSLLAPVVAGSISGFGALGYALGVEAVRGLLGK